MHILYKLTFASGKVYIGQTVSSMKTRMTAHRTAARAGSLLPVHCAWRKHGEPSIEVVAEYETHVELHAAEIAAIRLLNTQCPFGYNVTDGGDTAPSKNPEVAAKIAAKALGRKNQDPVKLSDRSKALWQDPEYQSKVSAGLKLTWTPERRAEAAARLAARSPESMNRAAAAEKLRGREFSEETRARMSASAKGKVLSEATKAKIGEASKARGDLRKMTPELKANLSTGIKAAWADPVKRERLTAARKAAWATRRAKVSPPGQQAVADQLAPSGDLDGALS